MQAAQKPELYQPPIALREAVSEQLKQPLAGLYSSLQNEGNNRHLAALRLRCVELAFP
jgi:hypothetical protein